MPIGTFANVIAVIIGSLIGLLLHKRFPEKIKLIVFQAIGLGTIIIGIQMALKVESLLILIFSLLIGGIIGQAIDLEKRFEKFGNFLKTNIKSNNEYFVEGLITAFLIFCIGSMTIIGAIDEGTRHDHSLLFTKSILDGFTSIALASTYGIGVLFSIIPLLIYQGGITLLAMQFQNFFSEILINQLTAIGGVLILGIGINLLEVKKIKITNLLPALVTVIIFTVISNIFK